jgi:hypothetical protein
MGYQSDLVTTVGTPYFWAKADQTPFINSGFFTSTVSTTGIVDILNVGIEGSYAKPSISTPSRVTSGTPGVYRASAHSWNIWIKSNSKPSANTAWAPYVTAPSYTATIATGAYIGTDGIIRYGQFVNSIQTPILTGGTVDVCDGYWHMITFTRNGSTAKLYVDGSLQQTSTSWISTATVTGTTVNFFQSESSHQVLFDEYSFHSSELTASNISTIYSGYNSTINISITETPATASNAHFPEPGVSTSDGISFGTEPLTATAEISYLSVSGNVNYEHSFAPASGIFTQPTLAFTFNDNTEVVTSITASAEFREPFSFGGQVNISTSGQLMEASASFEEHTIIVASGISYVAQVIGTASIEMIEPFTFGPTDRIINALPMNASNAILQGNATVAQNYFNLVTNLNPLIYYYGSNVNYGSSNPTTFVKDSGYSYSNAGIPLSGINDGNGYMLADPAPSNSNVQLTWTGQVVTDLKASHKLGTAAYEYWFKPANSSFASGQTTTAVVYGTGYFNFTVVSQNSTTIFFRYGIGAETYEFNLPRSLFTIGVWHHWVTNFTTNSSGNYIVESYMDGNIVDIRVLTGPPNAGTIDAQFAQFVFNPRTTVSPPGLPSFDEVAIYGNALSIADIIDHYSFINTFSPNKVIPAENFEITGEFPEPVVFAASNKNFPATPITASALITETTIDAQTFLNFTTTAITATSQFVNPTFFGTPDYRKDAELLTAFAEMSNNNFALDDTYFTYVQTNIAPFRYVTFDGSNSATDFGTDNDYAVVPTVYGGTATLPAFGINNVSIKTSGINYTTDGVILKESEWNDTWGTGQNTNHSSFWMQRSGNDQSSSGIRILWNLNGYKDNQHAILYQNNNKLHLQFNNGSGTFVDQATVADVNLFDYERHHVVIVFNHTNNNNNSVKLYVDSVLVMTVSLGAYTGTTTNYATSQPANDEAYNKPRLGIGCLITPFASTALSAQPQNTVLYIDEIHWAVTGLNQTQVTNLYNAMPLKDNEEWYADFFLAQNSTLVNPTFGAGTTRIAAALTASGQIINPTVVTQFARNVGADPMTASALQVEPGFFGNDVIDINFAADFMFASALALIPIVVITVPGTPMYASAKLQYVYPYTDPYRVLILSQQYKQLTAEGFVDDVWVWANTYTVGDLN